MSSYKKPRIRKFNKAHKFRGNKYSNNSIVCDALPPTQPRPRPSCSQDNSMPCPKVSSSSKKLYNSKVPKISKYSKTCVNFVVDLEQIRI